MKYRTWLEIDKNTILHNLREIKQLIKPKVKLMSIVKANAYGHGLAQFSKIIEKETDWFGVDSLEEGLILRNNGITKPILVLGYIISANLKEAIKNNLSLAVYNAETISALAALKEKTKVHVKIETGTMRQGIYPQELRKLVALIKQYPQIEIEGIYTHFANIEDTTNPDFAKEQLQKYNQALKIIKEVKISPLKHTASSAAIILYSETHFDMVRLGLSLYGYWSSPQTLVSARNLKRKIELLPALSWKAKIAQIKDVKANTPIGYGLTEKTSQDTKVAVIPIGYWDGYDRKLSSIGNVLIKGKRCKIIGRICMNMFMVDINHLPGVKVEDETTLIGKQGQENVTAQELAQKIGTINYEIITRINPLIPRIYI